MSNGTLDTSGPRPAVRLERHLPDPPPVVWQAITERGQLKAWFPCDVIVEGDRWEVGAPITFTFPPEVVDLTMTGTVLAGLTPERTAWQRHFDAYAAAFEPVIGPQEGPPAGHKGEI